MCRVVAVILATVAGLLLGGCGGNLPRYSVQDLKAKPEVSLFAPGSEYIEAVGVQATIGPGPAHPADTGSQLGTAAMAGEVEAFYQQALAQRGWTPYSGTNFRTSTGATRIQRWRKGDFGFQLSFFDPASMDQTRRAAGWQTYTTYYEIRLTEIYPR